MFVICWHNFPTVTSWLYGKNRATEQTWNTQVMGVRTLSVYKWLLLLLRKYTAFSLSHSVMFHSNSFSFWGSAIQLQKEESGGTLNPDLESFSSCNNAPPSTYWIRVTTIKTMLKKKSVSYRSFILLLMLVWKRELTLQLKNNNTQTWMTYSIISISTQPLSACWHMSLAENLPSFFSNWKERRQPGSEREQKHTVVGQSSFKSDEWANKYVSGIWAS